jgi:hypothetical protein
MLLDPTAAVNSYASACSLGNRFFSPLISNSFAAEDEDDTPRDATDVVRSTPLRHTAYQTCDRNTMFCSFFGGTFRGNNQR